MPHSTSTKLTINELHPTFGAEVYGVDFSQPIDDETFQEIYDAITKYGVCVFRETTLDDHSHVAFAEKFGELDDITPYLKDLSKHRLSSPKLFDVSNINPLDNQILPADSFMAKFNKGNNLFHVDQSFNPRRASYSLLRAAELPPPGTGGNTDFCDARTAFDDLSDELKKELLENDYVACHSMVYSRQQAVPGFMPKVKIEESPIGRHRLVQKHEPSGRTNLYVASHVFKLEGLSEERSKELIEQLYSHAKSPKYQLSVEWKNNGDLVMWDNTCVMHRATGGNFAGKHRRDMRRATVADQSIHAWGLNDRNMKQMGYPD